MSLEVVVAAAAAAGLISLAVPPACHFIYPQYAGCGALFQGLQGEKSPASQMHTLKGNPVGIHLSLCGSHHSSEQGNISE